MQKLILVLAAIASSLSGASCSNESQDRKSSTSNPPESEAIPASEDKLTESSVPAANFSSAAQPKENTVTLEHVWQFGPGGGGRMEGAAIYPHDPNILFLGSDMRTVARSTNRGRSWSVLDMRMINTLKARFRPSFSFGPKPEDAIFVTTNNGLLKSHDVGLTWIPVDGPWKTKFGVNTGPEFINLGPEKSGFAIAGFDRKAATTGVIKSAGYPAQLYKTFSANGEPQYIDGKLMNPDKSVYWFPMSVPPQCSRFINSLVASPGKFESWHLMITCPEGVFVNFEGGNGPWKTMNAGLPGKGVKLIDASYGIVGNASRLYVLTDCSPKVCESPVFVSFDKGVSWKMSGTEGLGIGSRLSLERTYQQIASSMYNGNTIYLIQKEIPVTITGKINIKPNDEGHSQIFASSDAGKTWRSIMHRHPDQVAPHKFNIIDRGWRSIGDWGWRQAPDGLFVNPKNPLDVFVGELISTVRVKGDQVDWFWKTADTPAFTPDSQGDILSSPRGGYPVMGALDFAFHPKDPNVQFLGMEDFAGWRTLDNTKTWEYTAQSQNPDGSYNVFSSPYGPTNVNSIAIGKGKDQRVWIAGGYGHNLPQWSQMPNDYIGYLGYSLDLGKTWKQVGNGVLPAGQVTSVVVDHKAVPPRVGVAVFKAGFYWSSDKEFKKWEKDDNGIAGLPGFPYKIGRDNFGRYFALNTIVPRGFNYSPGNLFIKNSAKESWKPIGSTTSIPYPVAVTFDPVDKKTIYLSAFSTPAVNKPVDGGVWASNDEGASWQRLGGDLFKASVFDIAVHPENNKCLVASVLAKGLYVSYDRGVNWARVGNFPADSPYKLVWDPRTNVRNRLVITTFGQGLWSLSVPCLGG